jgi:hypothetical protein
MSDALDHTEATLCVERLAEHQRTHGLTDGAVVRAFPPLGSVRTWRRMAARQWDTLPLDVWLPKLREICATLGDAGEATGAPAAPAAAVPTAIVTRHLAEADRCRRERNLGLARSHCRAARVAIEEFQRSLA